MIKDDVVLEKMAVKEKKPLLGIAVEVEESFIHCAKAFKSSGLWQPATWFDKDELPSAAKILFEHAKIANTSTEIIEERLQESYDKRLY